MNADVKPEVKVEIKTEPPDILTSLKDGVDDEEYIVPPKRFRRNQGAMSCCAIIREILQFL